MHAFETDRQTPPAHATLAHDSAGRAGSVTVAKNGPRPAPRSTTRPVTPAHPASEPVEPTYDRAFPQADGEP